MIAIPWLKEAQALLEPLTALRQAIHRRPELGNQEYHTAQVVEDFLHGLDIPTLRPLPTAVVGVLEGALPGICGALRADMDALPVQEDTSCTFASQVPGAMHACGHDFHTAALLGAAALLSRHRDCLPGTVKFFFQPDEEGDGGAQRMIAAGCMESPAVEAVFGAHVSPDLPAGTIGVRFGKFYAASDTFHVTVLGKSAHGAQPEKGADALAAAAAMVCALRKLPQTQADRCVLSVGTLHAGSAINIIADRAEFSGILRTLGPECRQEIKTLFTQTIRRIADDFGVKADICLRESYPGVVNTREHTQLVLDAAQALLGPENVVELTDPTMTTEDFGYFSAAGGSFYHIGVGGDIPLHSPRFLPPDALLPQSAALHAAVMFRYLESRQSASPLSKEK